MPINVYERFIYPYEMLVEYLLHFDKRVPITTGVYKIYLG